MNYINKLKVLLTILCISLLVLQAGCAKAPKSTHPHHMKDAAPKHPPRHLDKIPNALPRPEPLSRYGNKFKKGRSYVTKKKRYTVLQTSKGYRAKGVASWYGTKFHGRRTSSGETYNMYAMTAAHRTLPLPTYAKITNLKNGRHVIVKINDRGPFHGNRILDLSYAAAHKLGVISTGTAPVEIVSVDPRDHHGIPKHLLKQPPTKNPVKSTAPLLAKKTDTAMPLVVKPSIVSKPTIASKPAIISKPAIAKAIVPSQKLYLQMGSFSTRKHAETMVNKLAALFSNPILINEKSAGNTSNFHVRIGPLQDDQEAIRLTQKMARSKLPPPVVIRE